MLLIVPEINMSHAKSFCSFLFSSHILIVLYTLELLVMYCESTCVSELWLRISLVGFTLLLLYLHLSLLFANN